jgi:hypothetical protein
MVGDPIKLVAGFHPLTVDHPFFDNVSGRGRGPNERHRILARAHFADMALGDPEITQPLLSAAITEVDLCTYDIRAVDAKQWIAGVNMLTSLVDK